MTPKKQREIFFFQLVSLVGDNLSWLMRPFWYNVKACHGRDLYQVKTAYTQRMARHLRRKPRSVDLDTLHSPAFSEYRKIFFIIVIIIVILFFKRFVHVIKERRKEQEMDTTSIQSSTTPWRGKE